MFEVNYQRANYAVVANPDLGLYVDCFDKGVKESIKSDYRLDLQEQVVDVMKHLSEPLNKILYNTPYRKSPVMLERLKISCLLTFLSQLTLPQKLENKFSGNILNSEVENKFIGSHLDNVDDIILWHLDKGLSDYVRLLVIRLKDVLGQEIWDTKKSADLDDTAIDDIIATAYSTFDMGEEND